MLQARPWIAASLLLAASVSAADETPALKRLLPDSTTGFPAGLVVEAGPLVFTSQLLAEPRTAQGAGGQGAGGQGAQGPRSVGEEVAAVLELLESALRRAGSEERLIIRLHVAIADAEFGPAVVEALRARYPEEARPAVTMVVSSLRSATARVAIDAVALGTDRAIANVRQIVSEEPAATGRPALASIAPAGRYVFVSGQLEQGGSLRETTTRTLESLVKTLEWLQLGKPHVVQLKHFLSPMSQHAEAEAAVAQVFAGHQSPANVFIEWTAKEGSNEIELVAWVPAGAAPQAEGLVSFLTPPGMAQSPVFARLTVVDSPRLILTGGLTARTAPSAEGEVRDAFAQLKDVLRAGGSDFRHLAKATYYVVGEDASRALNEVRPQFYDPARPPAASKAPVRALATAGRGLTLDLIAVPAP